jgi:hypothetical protein
MRSLLLDPLDPLDGSTNAESLLVLLAVTMSTCLLAVIEVVVGRMPTRAVDYHQE